MGFKHILQPCYVSASAGFLLSTSLHLLVLSSEQFQTVPNSSNQF